MNIGVCYSGHNDTDLIPLLYCLTNGDVELIDGLIEKFSLTRPTKFKITDNGITYHFSPDLPELEYCDVKICAVSCGDQHKLRIQEYKDCTDYIILSRANGEGLGPDWINEIEECLKVPNLIFMAGQFIPAFANHPRVIIDPFITLYFFYNGFGYHFLNYYLVKEKNHLIGVYNRHEAYKPHRAKMIKYFKENITSDIQIFEPSTIFETKISSPILSRWTWQSMHVTTYLDYNQCVANIVFETSEGFQTHSVLTEKTLKSIIFQQADIFFIYIGSLEGIEWLHKKGFWFLNSEFYDKDNLEFDVILDPDIFIMDHYGKSLPLYRSVYESIEYLKKLKAELKNDTDVYNFLLNKYRDKIDANIRIFQDLLRNCEYKERLLSLVTNIKNKGI